MSTFEAFPAEFRAPVSFLMPLGAVPTHPDSKFFSKNRLSHHLLPPSLLTNTDPNALD